jgi:hypothetical protein
VSHLRNGDSQVAKEDDYRRYAAETVDLASRAKSTSDKGRLLAMAEAWLDLADRAHRLARNNAGRLKEHPSLPPSSATTDTKLNRLSLGCLVSG